MTGRASHAVTLGECSRHGRGSKTGVSFLARGQEEGCWGLSQVGQGSEMRALPKLCRVLWALVEAFQVTGEISLQRGLEWDSRF